MCGTIPKAICFSEILNPGVRHKDICYLTLYGSDPADREMTYGLVNRSRRESILSEKEVTSPPEKLSTHP